MNYVGKSMNDKILIVTITALFIFNAAALRYFMTKVTKIIDLIPVIEHFREVADRVDKMVTDFSLNAYKLGQIEDRLSNIEKKISELETFCKIKNSKG